MFDWAYDVDLNRPAQVRPAKGLFFQADEGANRIRFVPYRNGERVTLTGTVEAYAMLADGTTVTVSGNTSDELGVYADLSADCYTVPGAITVTVKIDDMTIGAIRGEVRKTQTETIVQEGS